MITLTSITRDANGNHTYPVGTEIPVIKLLFRETVAYIGNGYSEAIQAILISPYILSSGDVISVDGNPYRIVQRALSSINRNNYKLQRRSA